jgi:hypothetical protein
MAEVDRDPEWQEVASDPVMIHRSNALFSAIVATVAASSERRLSVRAIAQRVGVSAKVTANCIALHRYLRRHAGDPDRRGMVPMPMPPDFVIPGLDEEVDETTLGLDKRC